MLKVWPRANSSKENEIDYALLRFDFSNDAFIVAQRAPCFSISGFPATKHHQRKNAAAPSKQRPSQGGGQGDDDVKNVEVGLAVLDDPQAGEEP